MKFTLSWLKDYLETNASVQEISETLTMIGLEVEEIIDNSKTLEPFVVGEVIECGKHPDADKLHLLKVSKGAGDILQVVCGAPNVKKGLKGVLALEGVIIPVNGEPLKKGKIRGLESQGMLCSERELLLSDEHKGIIELPLDAKVGEKAAKYLNTDTIFEINITPNRSECLGVYGIARDLAAAGLGKLKPLNIPQIKIVGKSEINVKIQNLKACPKYVGRMIKGVKNVQSPDWLKNRLMAIGLRPISALVDITNYICYDLSHPLHVFDMKKLSGDITVRNALEGEKILALNEAEYQLDEQTLLIADDKKPLAIAGVMGGEHSGCDDDTVDVFLECAFFEPVSVARTGRKLQIMSDSRYRFERFVNPSDLEQTADIATKMIVDICGGQPFELVTSGKTPDLTKKAMLRHSRIKEFLGLDIPLPECIRILSVLGFNPQEKNGVITCTSPAWRNDIEGEHDLMEEVFRIYGYDKISLKFIDRAHMPKMNLTPLQRLEITIRHALAANGLLEAATWSFTSSKYTTDFLKDGQKPVMIKNPISADLDQMRPSLLINILLSAARNIDRGYSDEGLFEIGPEFNDYTPTAQKQVVSGVRFGYNHKRNWLEDNHKVDVFDAKADAYAALIAANAPTSMQIVQGEAPEYYHPYRSGTFKIGKTVLGYFGQIHPQILEKLGVKDAVCGFEVYIENIPQKRDKGKAKPYLEMHQLQPLKRDFAFIVDAEIPSATLSQAILAADKDLIKNAEVFDLYQGKNMQEGKKSLAVEVIIQPINNSLSEKDLTLLNDKIIFNAKKYAGADLRV